MMFSLLLEFGRDQYNPLRCGAFCWDKTALSLQFNKITLHFQKGGCAASQYIWVTSGRAEVIDEHKKT
jgi:hypothetical protein